MIKSLKISLCLCLISCGIHLDAMAQITILKGKVTSSFTNVPIALVQVSIQGLGTRVQTDSLGNYAFSLAASGVYSIECRALGYKPKLVPEVQVSTGRTTFLDISMEDDQTALKEVRISGPLTTKTVESPLSLRVIGAAEIKRNPGGNRDISKALQSLPGVATSTGFRNDIIVRGGAPNENRFYLDGVEIPNINHFATQGSTGGPVGLLNIDFIREVDFYSGAFPADRGNALSSVLDFKQRDGRSDKQAGALTLGSSDLALTGEGPLFKHTTYLGSVRRSYLDLLFKLIGLSFLPTYNDMQFKIKTKFDASHELTLLGLGAIDQFTLNLGAKKTEAQQYQLATIPVNSQNNYTLGAVYKYFGKTGYTTVVVSRNYLYNRAFKYQNNDPSALLLLDYTSKEIENKVRLETTREIGRYKFNGGFSGETGESITSDFNLQPGGNFKYQSRIQFEKYGIFSQLSRSFFGERLSLSAGVRADGNTFTLDGMDVWKHLSPRISGSYSLRGGLSINFSSGLYTQIPPYTLLSFRDSLGQLINKGAQYITNLETAVGLDFTNESNIKFSVEGFYKNYQHYPQIKNLGDTISLANFGSNFGVVGNRPLVGFGTGRAYGIEFLAQQRVKKGLYGIAALTLVRSEFQDKRGLFVPSSWDSRVFLALTGGKIFTNGWELGAKVRLSGGSPYTPYDIPQSSLIPNFQTSRGGIPNYNALNTERLGLFYQLDARVDKRFRWKKLDLDLFLDIQNLTNKNYAQVPSLVLDRDSQGNPQTLPGDPSRYRTKLLDNLSGNAIPTLGIILELTQ